MKYIPIDNLIVPNNFVKTFPGKKKIMRIEHFYDKYHVLDAPIVINDDNVIVDHYARYILAKKIGMKTVPVVLKDEYLKQKLNTNTVHRYIIGCFEGNKKEYIWRVPDERILNINDNVEVYSDNKFTGEVTGVVKIKKIFYSKRKSLLRHKTLL